MFYFLCVSLLFAMYILTKPPPPPRHKKFAPSPVSLPLTKKRLFATLASPIFEYLPVVIAPAALLKDWSGSRLGFVRCWVTAASLVLVPARKPTPTQTALLRYVACWSPAWLCNYPTSDFPIVVSGEPIWFLVGSGLVFLWFVLQTSIQNWVLGPIDYVQKRQGQECFLTGFCWMNRSPIK